MKDHPPGAEFSLRTRLPALDLDENELLALFLGLRWVLERADPPLDEAARILLRRIEKIVPAYARLLAENTALLAEPAEPLAAGDAELATLRRAIAEEGKLALVYTDAVGAITRRIVCPLAIGYFQSSRALLAWCDTRQDFRHFRTDRIRRIEPAPGSFSHADLMAEWHRRESGEAFTLEGPPAPP